MAAGVAAGQAAGGIAGVGPAAGGMAAPHGSMIVFNSMRESYLAHLALPEAAARAALRDRGPFKPAQVEPFNAGPGDIRVFADMLERGIKLAITITVARYYDDNEELGMAYLLSVFTGDTAGLARTALADTQSSDHASSSYWTVYKKFASQSQHKSKIINFFFPAKQMTKQILAF